MQTHVTDIVQIKKGDNVFGCTRKAFKNVYKEKGFVVVGSSANAPKARINPARTPKETSSDMVSAKDAAEKLDLIEGEENEGFDYVDELPDEMPHREILIENGITKWSVLVKMDADALDALTDIAKGRRSDILEYIKNVINTDPDETEIRA